MGVHGLPQRLAGATCSLKQRLLLEGLHLQVLTKSPKSNPPPPMRVMQEIPALSSYSPFRFSLSSMSLAHATERTTHTAQYSYYDRENAARCSSLAPALRFQLQWIGFIATWTRPSDAVGYGRPKQRLSVLPQRSSNTSWRFAEH